jgi:ubiquinone biosynthesis protein
VLKPGIEDKLEVELELLEQVGSYLDQQCDRFQIPHVEYQEMFEQVRGKLRCEVRLDLEQHHMELARSVYAGDPRIHIPGLLEHCTPRVTAMEWVTGGKVTDHGLDTASDRQRLATLVVQALIAQPIFSRAAKAIFHGDLHAGNLFLTEDQRLAVLDWSLAGSLADKDRMALVQILLSAVMLDHGGMVATLTELSEKPADPATLDSVARAWLRRIRQGQIPGFSWMMGMLDDAVLTSGVRFGADLMLFRKTLHTLDGVLADIGAECGSMDFLLMREFFHHLAAELPGRWISPPDWRGFPTRLSNNDIKRMITGIPWAAAQLWVGHWMDILEMGCPAHTAKA